MADSANKNIRQGSRHIEKIKGSGLIVNAREIFFAPEVHGLCEKMLNVSNAEEALKNFIPDPSKISLIVCNYELHDNPGIYVLDAVRNINNSNFLVPFVMLIPTAAYDELIKIIAWANELGVNDIISMPFSMDKIVSKMKLFVEFYYNTTNHRALLYHALSQISAGSYDKGLSTLDSYENLAPSPSSAHYDYYVPYFRGLASEKQGDIKKAEEYYYQSLGIAGDRHFAHARDSLIDLFVKTKRFDEAISEAEDAFNKSPLNPQWKLNVARAYLIQKDYNKADEIYKFLLAQNPKNQLYINKMVERFKKEQNIDEDQMSNLTDEQKEQIKKLSEKAKEYLDNNVYAQAIRLYQAIMKIDEANSKKYILILATLSYKWFKSLDPSGILKDNYKSLVSSIDYSLELLRMDSTDQKAVKLLIKIVQNEKKTLNKVLEPRIANEVISYVKDFIQV